MLATMPRGEVPLFLMTTNYDSFIERAFEAAGRPICVVTQNMRDPDKGATAVDLILPDGTLDQEESAMFQWADSQFPPGCAFLFKMHGLVHRPLPKGPDDVIITEDELCGLHGQCRNPRFAVFSTGRTHCPDTRELAFPLPGIFAI